MLVLPTDQFAPDKLSTLVNDASISLLFEDVKAPLGLVLRHRRDDWIQIARVGNMVVRAEMKNRPGFVELLGCER